MMFKMGINIPMAKSQKERLHFLAILPQHQAEKKATTAKMMRVTPEKY
jgi:hypothetical protein